MNKFIFTGNLTRDPELAFSQAGKAYAKFTVAVARPFKRDETDFFNVTAFGKQAENVAQYTGKGSKVLVDGQVNINQKEGKYYTNILADSVEFLSTKGSTSQSDNKSQDKAHNSSDDPFAREGTPIDISDDDLPF